MGCKQSSPTEKTESEFSPLMCASDRAKVKEIIQNHFKIDPQFIIHFSRVQAKMKQRLHQARDNISSRSDAESNRGQQLQQSSNSHSKDPHISFLQHSQQQPAQHLSREEKIQSGIMLLEERMINFQLEQEIMKDDGNCQFRSMAHQLFGNAEDHETIRHSCVEYLRTHSDQFCFFFDGDEEWQRYLTTMATNGTWGDELTLKAASNIFRCKVHVLTSEKESYYMCYTPDSLEDENTKVQSSSSTIVEDIFLAYISPIHYNSIHLVPK
mmetsp:Transcript_4611/g.6657  ORF Transcript_4611/g.6657 Transcript_4611/m.6657 type:complete len:268 (-) Transcript_4611:40-843(-)